MAAEWFYTTNRQQMGPVSWRDLCDLAESGVLKPHDMVWSEGMPHWIKASNQEGLFAGAAPTAIVHAEPPPSRGTRQLDEDDDEREEGRGQRTRRLERQRSGSVKIGLIVAGVLALLLFFGCAGGILVWFVVTLGGQRQDYTIRNLKPGDSSERRFEFRKGQRVVITVDSTVTHRATDVDLLVVRGPAGRDIIAMDNGPEKDCRVEFVVPTSGTYRVVVDNLGPGVATTCLVTITER